MAKTAGTDHTNGPDLVTERFRAANNGPTPAEMAAAVNTHEGDNAPPMAHVSTLADFPVLSTVGLRDCLNALASIVPHHVIRASTSYVLSGAAQLYVAATFKAKAKAKGGKGRKAWAGQQGYNPDCKRMVSVNVSVPASILEARGFNVEERLNNAGEVYGYKIASNGDGARLLRSALLAYWSSDGE